MSATQTELDEVRNVVLAELELYDDGDLPLLPGDSAVIDSAMLGRDELLATGMPNSGVDCEE